MFSGACVEPRVGHNLSEIFDGQLGLSVFLTSRFLKMFDLILIKEYLNVMEYFIFDVSVHSINLTSFLTFLFPPLSSFILIFLHSFGGLSILLSPPLSLSLSPTSPAPPSSCPAPSVMSLIHQPDSINRIPIAVCSLAARCCLCLYESITPTLTPTYCL